MWTEKIYIDDGNIICMVTVSPEMESQIIELHRKWVIGKVRMLLSTGQTIEVDSNYLYVTQ